MLSLKKKNCCLPILNFWIFVLSFTLLMIFESHLINQVSHITSLFSLNSSLIYHKWICNNSFHYNLLSLLYAFILFCFVFFFFKKLLLCYMLLFVLFITDRSGYLHYDITPNTRSWKVMKPNLYWSMKLILKLK